MSSLTRTQKLCALAVFALVFSGAMYYLLLAKIFALHTAVVEMRKVSSEHMMRTEIAQRTAAFIRDTVAERAQLASYFIPVDNPTPFLELLEQLGTDAGVELEVQSVTEMVPPASKGDTKTKTPVQNAVDVALRVEGTFERVSVFIRLIEHMPYFVSVDRISLTTSQQTGLWEGQVHLRVGIRTLNEVTI